MKDDSRWGLALLALTGFLALLFAGGVHSAGADGDDAAPTQPADLAVATFAGGCFWCMEPPFDKVDGVVSTVSGYTGGHKDNPNYKEVSAGGTGHTEAVQITYDPSAVSYETLLEIFWRNIDPITADRQFCDRGSQYRSAVFYHDENQARLAKGSRDALAESGRLPGPIVTEILAADTFYPAERYHQDYYQKNPIRYKYYRYACGRDKRLEELWGTDASPS
jgi:peptide-methionine (S)-S-oxide reductase